MSSRSRQRTGRKFSSVDDEMKASVRAVLNELRSDLTSIRPVQLPAAIIESFTKLWFESLENPDLEELVPRDCFRTVFDSMNEVFGRAASKPPKPSTSSCSGICKSLDDCNLNRISVGCEICEEDYDLINNNVEDSYFTHTQTENHKNIVKRFREEMTNAALLNERDGIVVPTSSSSFISQKGRKNSASASSSCAGRSGVSSLPENNVCLGFLEEEGKYYCVVCNVLLESSYRLTQIHLDSAEHLRKEKRLL